MSSEWMVTSKPTFHAELLALPPKETHQILAKIALLLQDPTPDAKTKKLLKYVGDHQVCRLRSGDYRLFYTYKQPYISLLGLRRRDDATYDTAIAPEYFGGLAPDLITSAPEIRQTPPAIPTAPDPARPAPMPARPLPEHLSVELLRNLQVPTAYHPQLLRAETEEDLLACSEVPDEHLLRLVDALFERPIDQVLAQPDYLTSVEDLQRYKEGDLLGFLLLLSPEQERYVTWALNAAGPTLVKGGPGTGKSTIALYRARAMLDALRKAGIARPRILFTTYTKALVAFSEQLLQGLLGEDAVCVVVRNVDKLVMEYAGPTIRGHGVARTEECRAALEEALRAVAFQGNVLQHEAQRETLARLSPQYLLEEFDAVIEARAIATLDEYLAAARPGRAVRLGATQRRAVWALYTVFTAVLDRRKLLTWGALRRRAAQAGRSAAAQYDGVVIDEAQDLDPNQIRLLVCLCRAPNRLFLTADANQSIYGSQFRWQDVHDGLRFRGRTGTLRTNFRTTRQIGEAAHLYVRGGELEDEDTARDYRTAGPKPTLQVIETVQAEAAALVRFMREAMRDVRLGIGACAVLVPSERAGTAVAARLTGAGLPALHMPGSLLDLKKACVKVITLKSAKGLEFPIVALAGFLDSPYPFIPAGAAAEEREEVLARERRTMFVGMTRAMRALLVTVPAGDTSPLLSPFDPALWAHGLSGVQPA